MWKLKYKSVKQNDMKDCGAACIATILKQYKSNVSVSSIREMAGTSDMGTNVVGMTTCLEQLNFDTKVIKADMKIFDDESIPYPAIAHIVKDEFLLHFVVIHKILKDSILISDPADGLVTVKKSDFEKMWTNVVIFTVPTEKYIVISNEKNALNDMLKILTIDKNLILYIALSAFTASVIGITTSFYFQIIIDTIIPNNSLKTLSVISLGIITLYIFQSLFDFMKTYLLNNLGNRMSIRLMLSYYNHVLKLPLNFFATRKSGEIISRFSDASKVINGLATSVLTVILDVTMLFIIGSVMFFQNSTLFTISLISIPFYIAIVFFFIKKYDIANHSEMENNSILNSFILESFNGIETIKSIQAEKDSSKKVDKLFVNYISASFKTLKLDSLQMLFKQLIQLISTTLVLWLGTRLVIKGELSIGQLITFNTMMAYFTTPLLNIINIQPQLQSAKVAAERLGEIMALPNEHSNENHKIKSDVFSGKITLNNLEFNYPMQRQCLYDINLCINSGEKVAIVGKSGSGKSTLSKLLIGYYKTTNGNILYNGFDIKNINQKELRTNVTIVPQTTFFFSGTIFENLTFGMEKKCDLSNIIHACKIACIHKDIENLPLGYGSYVEENGANFSGGQKQRLALARALLRESPILILDESTSSVDSFTERKIMNNLSKSENLTLIVISHKLSIVKNMDQIVVLKDKTIVEKGTHESLININGTYKKMWRTFK